MNKSEQKKLDKDILILRIVTRALNRTSSRRMLIANLNYLMDFYVYHPSKQLPKRLKPKVI